MKMRPVFFSDFSLQRKKKHLHIHEMRGLFVMYIVGVVYDPKT